MIEIDVAGKVYPIEQLTVTADLPRGLWWCWALLSKDAEAYREAVRRFIARFNEPPSRIIEHNDWSRGRMLFMLPPWELEQEDHAWAMKADAELPLFASVADLAKALPEVD